MCSGEVSGSFITAENSFDNVDFNYVVTRQRFGNMDKNRWTSPFFEFVPEAVQDLQFPSIESSVSAWELCIGVRVLLSSAFSMDAYALLSNAPRVVTEVLLEAADEDPAVAIMLFIILKDSV